MDNIYAERIEELRRLMLSKDWDAVVITGSDPHSSEYPAPRWKQVEWLSGFNDTSEAVTETVDMIKNHPLIPADITVRGFIMDSTTGKLNIVNI